MATTKDEPLAEESTNSEQHKIGNMLSDIANGYKSSFRSFLELRSRLMEEFGEDSLPSELYEFKLVNPDDAFIVLPELAPDGVSIAIIESVDALADCDADVSLVVTIPWEFIESASDYERDKRLEIGRS